MRIDFAVLTAAAAFMSVGSAIAACPDDASVDRYMADWTAKKQTQALPVAGWEDVNCARGKVVDRFAKTHGKVVGYKAGLTAKPTQERFGANAPIWGVLFEKMILDDGATVPAAFGGRVVWEADLLLVVKDEGINDATTPEQAVKHIRGMRPFIELPDLALAPTEKLDGIQLAAINVATRLGVAGPEIPIDGSPETLAKLGTMKIIARNNTVGTTVAENTGAATLGNPMNVVAWLIGDLKKAGHRLKTGDLISIGSFSPLFPVEAGQTVSVTYEGMAQPATVKVTFQ